MREVNEFIRNKILNNSENYAIMDIDIKILNEQTNALVNTRYRFSTLSYEIEVEGNIYQKDPGILDYDQPRQSSTVDREAFTLVISDNFNVFKNIINFSQASSPVKVRVGFFNEDGTPNTSSENFLVSYEGFIDKVSYSNDFEEALITFEFSSPMQDLGLVKTLITSKSGMDQFSLIDTSFDKIIDENESVLLWGKNLEK